MMSSPHIAVCKISHVNNETNRVSFFEKSLQIMAKYGQIWPPYSWTRPKRKQTSVLLQNKIVFCWNIFAEKLEINFLVEIFLQSQNTVSDRRKLSGN